MIYHAVYLLTLCAVYVDCQLFSDSKTTVDSRKSNFQQPGYLPPEEPAPAQVNPVIISTTPKPLGPTHHGRDLCSDPFHSFLCQNLKPRKAFTGANPPLQGANTFVAPSKVLAPPVNDIDEPTTTTTVTTKRPTTTTTKRPKTTTTTTKRPQTITSTTTEKPVNFEASNDVRSYLPPEKLAPAAAAPDLAIVKPQEDHHHEHHHRDICTDPFHSFLCDKLKPRKRITGDLPNHLQGANSFVSTKKVKPDPDISPQPSNDLLRAYLPPTTTTIRTTTRSPTPTTTTTRRPTTTTTRRPSPQPQPSNEIDRVYLPPKTTTTTLKPEPSNVDRSYLPPDQSLSGAAAQDDPAVIAPGKGSHGYKDICSDPFHSFLCVKPKPRVRLTGELPNSVSPQASNLFQVRLNDLKQQPAASQPVSYVHAQPSDNQHRFSAPPRTTTSGYTYSKPNIRLPQPSEIQEVGYNYPKPTVSLPEPTNGYSYPKPEKSFPLASEVKEVGYHYSKPSIGLPEPTKGYSYPKPDNRLTLPTENKEIIGYNYPKPTTGLPEPTIGYSYSKPKVELTLPSEIKSSNSGKFSQSTKELFPKLTKSYQSSPNAITQDFKTSNNQPKDEKILNVETIHGVSSQSSSADFIPVNKPVFGQRLKRRNKQLSLIVPANSHPL